MEPTDSRAPRHPVRRFLASAVAFFILGLFALDADEPPKAFRLAPPASPAPVRFSEHLIADKYDYAYGVAAADLDGDGDLDLTSGDIRDKVKAPEFHRSSLYWFENDGQGRFEIRHEVARYENVGAPGTALEWKKVTIGNLPNAFEAVAADLDADGDVDVAATSWARGDKVVWFENHGDPHMAWTMRTLKERFYAANQVIVADQVTVCACQGGTNERRPTTSPKNNTEVFI